MGSCGRRPCCPANGSPSPAKDLSECFGGVKLRVARGRFHDSASDSHLPAGVNPFVCRRGGEPFGEDTLSLTRFPTASDTLTIIVFC